MHSLPLPFPSLSQGRDTFCKASKEKSPSSPFGTHSIFRRGGARRRGKRETWQPGFAAPPLYIFGKRSSGFPNINFLERLGDFVVCSTFYSVWCVYESFFPESKFLCGVKVYRRFFWWGNVCVGILQQLVSQTRHALQSCEKDIYIYPEEKWMRIF